MRLLFASLLITLCACQPPAPDDQRLFRSEEPAVQSRGKLEWRATGVSIDAEGERSLWVPGQGVVQLKRGGPELVLPAAMLGARQFTRFEDLAVLDSRRIALIAQDEGLVIDRQTGQELSRFCYRPDDVRWQDPIAWQLSRALGYDPQEDRLYVQPQTFPGGGTTASTSQVGLFDPKRDEPLEWRDIDQPTFSAGGLAVETRERTWLGMGTRLYLYDARTGTFGGWWDLFGTVTSIDGLAFDRQHRTLVVLDAEARELVELKLDVLQ